MPGYNFAVSLAVAFLPWLHVKLLAPALISTVFLGWWRPGQSLRARLIWLIPIASCAALFAYNRHAFGGWFRMKVGGEAIVLNPVALMVSLGLHFGQAMGFLFQNPIHLAGVFLLAGFLARRPWAGIFIILLFASIMVPNGLHPTWWWADSIICRSRNLGVARLAAGRRLRTGLCDRLRLHYGLAHDWRLGADHWWLYADDCRLWNHHD